MNPLENCTSSSLSSSMSIIDLLNTTCEQPPSSSELQFRSDLPPLRKLPPVPNNQSFTKFTNPSTNSDSILLDMNNDEWFCSPGKEDDGGCADTTGVVDGGEEMDFQVSVSSNLKGPPPDMVSRLQDIVQEQEEVGLKTTSTNSSDTVLGEFRIEDLEDELDESLCRKKTKREIQDELNGYFEDLVNKMMKKQEDMYKVLLETIEHKEKSRIAREETWKNLVKERMRKEEERRSQDTHRSLALLSLLQKFLGQKIINNPGALAQQEINTPQSTEQQKINIRQSLEIISRDESDQKKQRIHNWTNDEAQALISLRLAIGQKFLAGATKFRMSWEVMSEEMSRGMASMGFAKTPKQCKDKWDSMSRCFNKAERSGKTPAENAKTCPYFQELDLFYKKLLRNLEKAPEAETEAS